MTDANQLFSKTAKDNSPTYSVFKFPSLYGTPWETNSGLVAAVYAVARWVACTGLSEIRVINNKTDKQTVLW